MAVSIAHLSDPHITTGALAAEPAFGLQRALSRTLALEPRPDHVVITGDLVDGGHPEEYLALREIIGRFPLSLHLAPGNHDNREALLDAFAGSDQLGGGSRTHYVVDQSGATIVVLDSLVTGAPAGELGAEQLAWLDDVLARRARVPAFVCLHHPPMPIGIPFLDGMRLNDGDALSRVIARHPQVVRVLAGHVHRPIAAAFAGSTLAIAPSTYRQSALCMSGDRSIGYLNEPTGFLLHLLSDAHCVTHTVQVSHAGALLGAY